MNEMLKALDLIEHRIEEAKRSFHNSQRWDEEESYWAAGKTYQQEIDEAFAEARELAKKL